MTYTRHTLLALTATLASTTPIYAQTETDFSTASRAEFVAAYEENFIDTLAVYRDLIIRADPAFAQAVDVDTPISEVERASFDCAFDGLTALGELNSLAQQKQTLSVLRSRMADDPQFSFANVLYEDAVLDMLAADTTDAVISVMKDCDSMKISQDRVDMSPALFQAVQKTAVARGLVEDN